jgi:hypothetical protein
MKTAFAAIISLIICLLTGMPIYYYVDPKTRKPVYTNPYPSYGYPYYGSVPPYYSPDYLPTGYVLPTAFY